VAIGRAVVLIFSLFGAINVSAFDDVEDYLDLQSGSLMGLAHASYGARLDSHNLMIGIGYVPELSYHKEMLLYSLRYRYENPTSWDIKGMAFTPFNFGVGVLIGDHPDLFVQLPERYPDGYYTPSAFRIIFNYQAALQVTPQLQAYFDMSIMDVGFIGYIREPDFYHDNYDYIGLEGIMNWGFGARYVF